MPFTRPLDKARMPAFFRRAPDTIDGGYLSRATASQP